jgi:hypothetical protein
MSVNANARKAIVLFGANEIDCSEFLVSFENGYNLRDETGWLKQTSKLVLGISPGFPDLCNPYKNLDKLYRGELIKIKVRLSDGSIADFRTLYIIAEPPPPQYEAATIEFELGTREVLRAFAKPDKNAPPTAPSLSTIPAGTAANPFGRTAAINRLASAAKVPLLIESIEAFPPPTPEKNERPYVDEMGELAFGGLAFLHIDRRNQLRSKSALLSNITPVRSFEAARDCISYRFHDGGELPPEELVVNGTGKNLISNYQTTVTIDILYGPAESVSSGTTGIVVIKQTVTTDAVKSSQRILKESSTAPRALVLPGLAFGDFSLDLDEEKEERYFFEAGGERRLKRKESTVKRYLITGMAEYFNNWIFSQATSLAELEAIAKTVVTAQQTVTDYIYSIDGTVKSIQETVYEPFGNIIGDENLNNPDQLTTAKQTTIRYWKLGPRRWKRVTTVLEPAIRITGSTQQNNMADMHPDTRVKLKSALQTRQNKTEVSSSGATQPPAAERAPEPWEEEEYPIETTVKFSQFANPDRDRKETIQIPNAVSKEQLTQMGQIIGAVRYGRAKGIELMVAGDDDLLLSDDPLPIWSFTLPDGRTDILQMNALQYVFDQTRCVVSGFGIRVGTIYPGALAPVPPYPGITLPTPTPNPPITTENPTPAPQPPIEVVIPLPQNTTLSLFGGVGFGGWLEYDPTPPEPTTVLQSGVGFGGWMERINDEPPVAMHCGVGFGGSYVGIDYLSPASLHCGAGFGGWALEILNCGVGFGGWWEEPAADLSLHCGAGFGGWLDIFADGQPLQGAVGFGGWLVAQPDLQPLHCGMGFGGWFDSNDPVILQGGVGFGGWQIPVDRVDLLVSVGFGGWLVAL